MSDFGVVGEAEAEAAALCMNFIDKRRDETAFGVAFGAAFGVCDAMVEAVQGAMLQLGEGNAAD